MKQWPKIHTQHSLAAKDH